MARWDSPLFTLPWLDPALSPALTLTSSENAQPTESQADEIWKAVSQGAGKAPNMGTRAVSPHPSFILRISLTNSHKTPKPPSDALRTLESTTASLVALLLSSTASPTGGLTSLSLPLPPSSSSSASLKLSLTLPPRALTLPELQRLKRQFVAAHKKVVSLGAEDKDGAGAGAGEDAGKGGMDWSEEGVARRFVRYVEENLRA